MGPCRPPFRVVAWAALRGLGGGAERGVSLLELAPVSLLAACKTLAMSLVRSLVFLAHVLVRRAAFP